MIKYKAKIFKDGDTHSVLFPDLPGCFSMGDTLEEAKKMAKDSLSLYLTEARDPKWKIPAPKDHKGRNFYWIKPNEDVGIPLMLRKARLDSNMTQKQLADELGITVQQIQKLETPGKSNPTIKTLQKISTALSVDLEIKFAG